MTTMGEWFAARPLRYRRLWLLIGALLVALVVYLSLTPRAPSVGVDGGDKLGHLLAYGLLMGWFVQIYTGLAARAVLALGLALLGVVLEILQGLGGARMFEVADMVANTLGVLLAWSLADTRFGGLLWSLERRLALARSRA